MFLASTSASTTGVVIVVIVVVVIVLIAVAAWTRMRRRQQLQSRFGPEYDHAVRDTGSRSTAESELQGRLERRQQLEIRPLPPGDRDRYLGRWQETQTRFVDSPSQAVREADLLVVEVMRQRGYPMDDFDQRAADISVDHPQLVEDYRQAHRISTANDQNQASTEDLRQALVHYRSLFNELLQSQDGTSEGTSGTE